MFDKATKTCRQGAIRQATIDFLDNRILALLDEQPFHSVYSIAEALCVSHSTMLSHLRESLRMKIFHLLLDPAQIHDQFARD
jgi:hypothetical protein